ncbi:MAG: DUF115 domain-containing protein [Oscillospiraceae bacterium]|jgi:hypothetical protein|nr:DUF115 domain-containing protein [Oscillospiraceae bacterium]
MKYNFRDLISEFIPPEKQNSPIYFWGLGENWEELKKKYKVLGINLEEEAEGLIDKNKGIKPDDLNFNNDMLVFVISTSYCTEIDNFLIEKGLKLDIDVFHFVLLFQIAVEKLFEKSIACKNKHDGEECFIICNGPSLKPEDLQVLHEKNIPCFGLNGISNVFEKTDWRPNYYVTSNPIYLKKLEEISKTVKCPKFILLNSAETVNNMYIDENVLFFYVNRLEFSLHRLTKPTIGTEIYNLSPTHTITHCALQIAIYMGFKKIYLLGLDNNFKNSKGEVVHFYKRVSNPSFVIDYDLINDEYQAAKDYAENNGIEIYNATRGGELEVFERVNFDKLF